MNNKDTILIVVTTEMGLLMSLLYFYEFKEKDLEAYFILLKGKKERFNNLNLDSLPGEYKLLDDRLQVGLKNTEKGFFELFNLNNIKEVVIQNPYSFISNALISHYSNKNKVKKTLISDGLAIFSNLTYKSRIILTSRLIYHKYINKLYFMKKTVPYNKIFLKKIDNLIAHKPMQGPSSFINTDDILNLIPSYSNNISKIFSLDLNSFFNNKIIFFTQPIYLQNSIPKNIHKNYWLFLDNFFDFINKNKLNIIIKVHPSEDINLYHKYKSNYVTIDTNKNIPAEMILNLIPEQLILSMFSSISLVPIKGHKNLWLYKIINYKLKKIDNTSHILCPESFEKLKNIILKKKILHEKNT